MDQPYYDRRPPTPRRSPLGLLLQLVGILAILYLGFRAVLPKPVFDRDAESRPVAARGELSSLESSTIELFRRASPSVVHIANIALVRNRWSLDEAAIPQGTGSGFIWNPDGYVVTNAHVVRGGDRFHVTMANQTTWPATLVGAEPDHDVAVLKLEGTPRDVLLPLAVGSSADLEVGQSVFAIGNPFGLDQTLTTGVISGTGREFRADTGRKIHGAIQTDAAINPGNSGGPLLDSAGRLVGMNTAIYSMTGSSAGIGFAIPVDMVNRIVPRIIRGERVERAGLGILMFPDQVAARSGLEGVVIREVLRDSGAARAGLRPASRDPRSGRTIPGDVIVEVDGKPIRKQLDLLDSLDGKAVGDEVEVTVLREGTRKKVEVTLVNLSQD
jgi:S1-C subfamily serine protease